MIIAVDTGGTKTLITAFSDDGIAGEMIKFKTPPLEKDYVTLLKETVKATYGGQRIDAIVIALPGTIKDGVALWCNNLKWKNFDAQTAFTGMLGTTPVWIENDANLAGLAETRSRDPMPTSSLYVTVSTGIGTGVTTKGVIDPGLQLSEGGRMLVEYNGEVREWESFASGKAIYTTYNQYARDIIDKATWNEIADRISRGFLAAIPLLQPEIIIIGGSIGTYFERYETELKTILRTHLPSHIPLPEIVAARHPEEAVIYGCYYYAIDNLSR
jgi:predicted NBD/HSP70 family sugar kinase